MSVPVIEPASPLVLKDVELVVELHDFRHHVSGVTFTPPSSLISWTGAGGNTHYDVPSTGWSVSFEHAQDWGTTGLARYLYDHDGETVAVSFKPAATGVPTFTADVTFMAGPIGGSVNAFMAGSVSCPCTKPTITD